MTRHTLILLILPALIGTGCANRGIGPQGGSTDSIPPRVVRSHPLNGAIEYKDKKIDIAFDEYVLLNNPSENVLFSPPQRQQPEVRAIGKKIRLVYKDTLKENTTYTVDFGNAIQDNNENNPLGNYSFSFSTGKTLDSLEIYGTLLDAATLSPLQGLIAGIYSDTGDTVFERKPFSRIGKTGEDGDFVIRNIHEGTYRLYALQDMNRDYMYQPGEMMAFYDKEITPYITVRTEVDTVWRDSVTTDSVYHLPDSVYTAEYYYYEPSDIIMLCFQEDKQHVYLERVMREKRQCFSLVFKGRQPAMPRLQPLPDDSLSDWLATAVMQNEPAADTLTVWLTDTMAIKTDSLCFTLTYQKSDSVYQSHEQTDTLWAVYRMTNAEKNAVKKKNKRKNKDKEEAVVPALSLTLNTQGKMEVYDTVTLFSATPIQRFDSSLLTLERQQDTLWLPVFHRLQATDKARMRWQVTADLQPKNNYRLTLDSAAVTDVYGLSNRKTVSQWKQKSAEDYSTLLVRLEENDPRIIVQLINEKDQPLYEQRCHAGQVKFVNVTPGTYYMRLFVDENNDGQWTTGELLTRRQPEKVYYFPKKLILKANWDFEEAFLWKNIPLPDQRPRSLLNNGKQKKK